MLTEEGIGRCKKRHHDGVPLWFYTRSPHPAVSTATFSQWEKDARRRFLPTEEGETKSRPLKLRGALLTKSQHAFAEIV